MSRFWDVGTSNARAPSPYFATFALSFATFAFKAVALAFALPTPGSGTPSLAGKQHLSKHR